ncbi:site-specific integrase [Luteimonas fraxinea]|uniref:Site-specific integrase n=1 Tax=Luteimonas fraxinea TaxID=2901869 RepID=A0ABS8UB42_9GAMM|nr:site-specific integrase [Luteimonas fraxinea]MCD9096703.1 site-specific integrase [Luteimonas fraxinea]MCD9126072.1 site-specific integrase [Luteimonas fraxinea]
MRIPHHMSRSPSGRWAFRQRVPLDLQPVLGCRLLKRSLLTNDLPQARVRALLLAASYARLFGLLRDRRVAKLSKEDADALIERLSGATNLRDLTLHRTLGPDGTVSERWQIDDEKDVLLFQKIQQRRVGDDPIQDMLDGIEPVPSPPRPHRGLEPIQLGKARDAWLATLKGSTLPKTYTIKKTAIEALVKFLGDKTRVASITRSDLARWYQAMRAAGASTPTLTNKQSYVGGKGGFFDWAIASGYYPKGDNPASGHVSYSAREKRARRKLGFKAFDREQVQALFAPAAFERLSASARWASLIGLYTGARASEVGQLLVSDVLEIDGVACIRISDEGEHQKVKTDVSLRTVPVHPDLIRLGFLEWVNGLRQAKHTRLFPAAKADAKNGQGNWISKAYSRHVRDVGKGWPAAKRGFHSLRKTLIQELQGIGVVSELRAQIVGHELDDEHHGTYSRDFSVREKLDGLGPHSPGLKALSYDLILTKDHV